MTREELLLREYELCQSNAQHLEDVIWKTSAIIGLGSVAAIGLVAKGQIPGFWPNASIGLLVLAVSVMWYLMACRWWSIQQMKFMRMRHIEESLRLWQMRYVTYADESRKAYRKANKTERILTDSPDTPLGFPLRWSWEIKNRVSKNEEGIPFHILPAHQRPGPKKILFWLPVINFFVWGVFLAGDFLFDLVCCILRWIFSIG